MSDAGYPLSGLVNPLVRGVQNTYANLTSPSQPLTMADAQRQMLLAEQLRQQSQQDIPVQSYKGIQAPIPWTAVLGKALQAAAANYKEASARRAEKTAYQKTIADTLGDRTLVPNTDVSMQDRANAYSAPATDARGALNTVTPTPAMAQMGYTGPLGAAMGDKSAQMLSSILQGMDPKIGAQVLGEAATGQIKQQGDRDNLLWQNKLPMSAADIQKLDKQSANTKDEKLFENQLPMTAKDKAELAEKYYSDNIMKDRIAKAGSVLGLSPDDSMLLQQGIAAGDIDPNRINSRTAKLIVDIYRRSNGTLNMVNAAGEAAMKRNPTYQRTINVAETLPTVLENMRTAGKKLNYSDIAFVGKLQGWLKGQTNDPNFVNYMTQRNDGLLTLAQVMRGIGMSDKATELEEQANNPTMSPRAVDAYVNAQQASLAPRLEKYRRDSLGSITHPPAGTPAAPTGGPTKSNW